MTFTVFVRFAYYYLSYEMLMSYFDKPYYSFCMSELLLFCGICREFHANHVFRRIKIHQRLHYL